MYSRLEMKWPKISLLSDLISKGELSLGRGDVISNIDINNSPGPFPIYSSSSKNEGEMGAYGKYMFDEELITWSVDGGGSLFYRPKHKFSVTNVSGYMRLNEKWDYKFVAYCLQLQHRYITFDYQAKAHPSVIKELYFLPELEKSEQTTIATILDTLDTQIRQTEAIIAKLQQVKQGLLNDLLTRGIDESGQLRPTYEQAPELYKDSPLGWIPKEWRVSAASEFCTEIIDCKNRTPPESPDDYAVIKTSNIKQGALIEDGLTYTDERSYQIWTARGEPKAGDLVVTREAPIGESFVIEPTMPKMCLGQRMMLYRPDLQKARSEFLHLSIMFELTQRRLLDLAGGSTVGHVRVGDVRDFLFSLPETQEQRRIEKYAGNIKGRLSFELLELQKLKKQKAGLMDDLLTGRVRVTELIKQQQQAS